MLSRQFLRFSIVGTIGLLVDIGVLELAVRIPGVGPYAGRALSFLAAATTTWALNRHFTFATDVDTPLHHEWARYVSLMVVGFTVNYGVYAALVWGSVLVREYLFLGVAAGSIAGLFVNYTASRKLVFKG